MVWPYGVAQSGIGKQWFMKMWAASDVVPFRTDPLAELGDDLILDLAWRGKWYDVDQKSRLLQRNSACQNVWSRTGPFAHQVLAFPAAIVFVRCCIGPAAMSTASSAASSATPPARYPASRCCTLCSHARTDTHIRTHSLTRSHAHTCSIAPAGSGVCGDCGASTHGG